MRKGRIESADRRRESGCMNSIKATTLNGDGGQEIYGPPVGQAERGLKDTRLSVFYQYPEPG